MSRPYRCGIDAGERAGLAAAHCCFIGGSSRTSSNTASSTSVQETNLQDSGGTTVANSTGVNITDGGAIQANSDISKAAIALGSAAIASGASVANKGLDNAAAAYQSGLTFGTDAIQTVRDIAQQSAAQNEQLVGDAIAGFQTLAVQNSASSSTQIQKVALWALAAMVLIMVVPKVFK